MLSHKEFIGLYITVIYRECSLKPQGLAGFSRLQYAILQSVSKTISRKHVKARFVALPFFLPLHLPIPMATPRRPLGPISGNLTRGKDTSPYVRGRIVEARDGGMKVLAIIAKFQVSHTVV